MKALDTNILVRFLTADDQKQFQLAYQFISNHKELFIPKTVLLELEWVLSSAYEISKEELVAILFNLFQMEHLVFEQENVIDNALTLYSEGLDFADAIHVSSATNCTDFITFDKKLIKNAPDANGISVKLPT